MKKGSKLLLGGLTVAAAAAGAIATVIMKDRKSKQRLTPSDTWARPGMSVTFRAELMPGRDADERTYKVTDLLPSGRVLLDRVSGEHARREFEQR